MLVDLPVQVLTEVLAAREAVDLLVWISQELGQLLAVSAFAVDLRVSGPIGRRLDRRGG